MPTHRPTVPISLPLLVLLPLTLLFSLLTLAFASRTLSLFNSQQTTNPWLLPLWRGHFDLRGLQLVVGTSAAIVLLDGVAMLVMLLSFLGLLKTATLLPTLPTVIATTSLLSTLLALPATILPLVLNSHAPTRDTLQSWTCGWISRGVRSQNGLPGDFGRVCGESRFATYAPVVLLVLHLGILALALLALKQARGSLMMKSRGRSAGASAARGEEDGEKMIELGEYEKMPRDKA